MNRKKEFAGRQEKSAKEKQKESGFPSRKLFCASFKEAFGKRFTLKQTKQEYICLT